MQKHKLCKDVECTIIRDKDSKYCEYHDREVAKIKAGKIIANYTQKTQARKKEYDMIVNMWHPAEKAKQTWLLKLHPDVRPFSDDDECVWPAWGFRGCCHFCAITRHLKNERDEFTHIYNMMIEYIKPILPQLRLLIPYRWNSTNDEMRNRYVFVALILGEEA